MWTIAAILLTLAVLNYFDTVVTLRLIEAGGIELNPVPAALIKAGMFEVVKIGFSAFLCILAVAAFIVRDVVSRAVLGNFRVRLIWRVASMLILGAVILYTLIVINNLYWIGVSS